MQIPDQKESQVLSPLPPITGYIASLHDGALNVAVISYAEQYAKSAITAQQQEIDTLKAALQNSMLLAARHRREEWAPHILRFCETAGILPSPLRDQSSKTPH